MTDSRNRWRTVSSRDVYGDDFIGLRVDEVVTPGGEPGAYSVVNYRRVALGVIPLTEDGEVHLVGQWRYPLNLFAWEIPEGGGDPKADPLDEIRRELREETGLEADSWREILHMHMSNSSTDERAILYLATGLRRAGEPELESSEQDMEQDRIPFGEALARALRGEITDAMSVAALLRVHHMAVQGELEPALAQAVLKPSTQT